MCYDPWQANGGPLWSACLLDLLAHLLFRDNGNGKPANAGIPIVSGRCMSMRRVVRRKAGGGCPRVSSHCSLHGGNSFPTRG